MKVAIISRKMIKPSSPTPNHHKNLKLSLLDQAFPPSFYANTIFFYSSDSNSNHGHNYGGDVTSQQLAWERSDRLQKSLSKTLVAFYPFAGQLKDHVSVECNDEGAYFVEARSNCSLLEILSKPKHKLLPHFIPAFNADEQLGSAVLLVQFTVFNCGGITLGVSHSHKIADASSTCTFFQRWAASTLELESVNNHDRISAVNNHDQISAVLPEFVGSSLLPPSDMPFSSSYVMNMAPENLTTRRFVFSAPKIASLSDKISRLLQQRGINITPTKVEVVSAVLFKCANAARRSSNPSATFKQAVDLRRRMSPPLPENAIGNLVWSFQLLVENKDIELHELVAEMRRGSAEFCNEKANRLKGEEGVSLVFEGNREEFEFGKMGIPMYCFASIWRHPMDEMDFGWGKPIWFTFHMCYKNTIMLLAGTRNDQDIEALVTLEEQEMTRFQRDEMLLAVAAVNPSVVVSHCRM
ncbi:hypothetical protein ACFX2A_040916 [Malus domestica]